MTLVEAVKVLDSLAPQYPIPDTAVGDAIIACREAARLQLEVPQDVRELLRELVAIQPTLDSMTDDDREGGVVMVILTSEQAAQVCNAVQALYRLTNENDCEPADACRLEVLSLLVGRDVPQGTEDLVMEIGTIVTSHQGTFVKRIEDATALLAARDRARDEALVERALKAIGNIRPSHRCWENIEEAIRAAAKEEKQ